MTDHIERLLSSVDVLRKKQRQLGEARARGVSASAIQAYERDVDFVAGFVERDVNALRKLVARVPKLTWGVKLQSSAWWIGAHYSKHNLRWCINLIPCVTVWITKPGGKTP